MSKEKELWEMDSKEIQDYYVQNSPEFETPGIDFFGFVEGPLVHIEVFNA